MNSEGLVVIGNSRNGKGIPQNNMEFGNFQVRNISGPR